MKSEHPSPVPGVSPSRSPDIPGPDGTLPPVKGIQSDILEIEPEDDEVLVYSQPTNPIHVTRPKDSDLIGGAATAPRKKKAPPKRTTGTLVTIVGAGTVAAAFLMLFVVIGVLTLAIGLRLYLG